MDYNLYDLDHWGYTGLGTKDGLILEYDRQLLSVLYNDGKDVAATDPRLPMCRDEDVPNGRSQGAIDPFCLQYDGGNDPSEYLRRNVMLLTDPDATIGPIESLPHALLRANERLPDAATIKDLDAAKTALGDHKKVLSATVKYYLSARLGRLTKATRWMLGEFQDGALPDGLDAGQVRARAWDGLQFLAGLQALPQASDDALTHAVATAEAWLEKTPAFISLTAADQAKARTDAMASLVGLSAALEDTYYPSIRVAAVGAQKYTKGLPYSFTSAATGTVDYETEVIHLLEKSLATPTGPTRRTSDERQAYATSLTTFAPTAEGKAAIERVKTVLGAELVAATDSKTRDAVRALLDTVNGVAADAKKTSGR
jgi:hypothetical protein